MRLAEYITGNIEPILVEWEAFARTVWPGPMGDSRALRDHGENILRATVRDMNSAQTAAQQSDKSKGEGSAGKSSIQVDGVSDVHAVGRVRSGFDLLAVVAEYRALRASVIRLWRESIPDADRRDLEDVTRFNECIDQSLTMAVSSYTQQVEHSRRMFLAILGHDLRSPLNSVVLSAHLLAMEGQLDPESSRAVSQITASSLAMSQMIGDLLDFTGIGLGVAMPLSPAAMDLKGLCEEVIDEMRSAHPTSRVDFEARDDVTGTWDAARLRQVVSNLLGNAIQHGAADSAIGVSVRAEGSDVLMAFSNAGPPIPPDAIPTLFDPLVRGSDEKKPRRPGSIGLGLHIAHEVVLAHGGSIDVKSSTDAGTVFTVRLPRQHAGG